MTASRIPPQVHLAVERDRLRLEAEGRWTSVRWGLQTLRLARPTYAALEYGVRHSNGQMDASNCTRYYYSDGTFYSQIRG